MATGYLKKNLTSEQNLAVAKMISEGMRQLNPQAWASAIASVRRNMRSTYVKAAIEEVKK